MEVTERHLTFREALKEVDNGYIIESLVTGNRYVFSPEGVLVNMLYTQTPTEVEIRNKWKTPTQEIEKQVFRAGSIIYQDKESADCLAASLDVEVTTSIETFTQLIRFEPYGQRM